MSVPDGQRGVSGQAVDVRRRPRPHYSAGNVAEPARARPGRPRPGACPRDMSALAGGRAVHTTGVPARGGAFSGSSALAEGVTDGVFGALSQGLAVAHAEGVEVELEEPPNARSGLRRVVRILVRD
jgi:hypothetical protein